MRKRRVARRKTWTRVCARQGCGEVFHPWHESNIYHNLDCARLARTRFKDRVCAMSGCEVTFHPRKDTHIYCSRHCQNMAKRFSRNGAPKPCANPQCEQTIHPLTMHHSAFVKRKYCTQLCGASHANKHEKKTLQKPLTVKECVLGDDCLGERWFMPENRNQQLRKVTCSEACRKELRARKIRPAWRDEVRVCAYVGCGAKFSPTRKDQVMCSKGCAGRHAMREAHIANLHPMVRLKRKWKARDFHTGRKRSVETCKRICEVQNDPAIRDRISRTNSRRYRLFRTRGRMASGEPESTP